MSVDAMTYAKTLRVGPRMKGLLLVIAKNTFNDTGTCKVGQEVLSRETEIPERTLRRYLAELEHLQAIKRRRVGVPGRGGRLHDEIHLTGFLDWLRDHRQIKPAKVADRKSVV